MKVEQKSFEDIIGLAYIRNYKTEEEERLGKENCNIIADTIREHIGELKEELGKLGYRKLLKTSFNDDDFEPPYYLDKNEQIKIFKDGDTIFIEEE